MMRFLLPVFSLVATGLMQSAVAQNTNPPFEIVEGDRVVLIGDTLIEREQAYGFVESRLYLRFPGRRFLVRNLGWSGDTPAGESRASFDFADPKKGFERLREQLVAVKPTVVIVGYGMASSFDGERGLSKFKGDLNRLLDAIQQAGERPDVKVILLSPIRHEVLPAPLPDPAPHNEKLALYTAAIREIATARQAWFVSLYDALRANPRAPGLAMTDNGIHLTAYGYAQMADAFERELGWKPTSWRLGILKEGTSRTGTEGITASDIKVTDKGATFSGKLTQLGNPTIIAGVTNLPSLDSAGQLQIPGLRPGAYSLKVDGQPVAVGSDQDWRRGVSITRGPWVEQSEALRRAVVKKSELFFHRWRPENETYLFGFRKQEQGRNAREIPMFDPLVQAEEAKIFALASPKQHSFELVSGDQPLVKKPEPKAPDSQPSIVSQPVPQFEVAPGFEVNLFAENPQLAKPIQMNFDPQGRLWIASSSVYPQIQPGQEANDKILVVEDTDGDGKADRSSVFAEGLLIPTGVAPGDGGVYVGQSTELLHFKDTDGDGKADVRRVVLSGFGTEDTHHILHTLRWGPDGQLYFNQSIYIHSHLETPHGVIRANSGAVFNLRPSTMQLEIFLKGFCNPWGHDFDQFGQSFVTDGAGFQGISYGVRGATYFTYAGMRREMKSVSPGNYPKFCGLEVVASPHFPADWQGSFITCDFRAHRVVHFGVAEQGAGYATSELPDLLRTTNVTFRPIDVKFGPDGALYIADWSNPIIQHGEVDFRDPRRDHEHGRIWRVTAKGKPVFARRNLPEASTADLLGELVATNGFNRQQARRVLAERGTKLRTELEDWSGKLVEEKSSLEALWLFQAIDVPAPALLERLLKAKDAHVRAAAVRVLSFWHQRIPNAASLLETAIVDDHPRVRLETVRALARIPSARSAELVLSALDKASDYFLEYAIWLSINDLAPVWIDAVQSGKWASPDREKQLEYALKAIEPSRASQVLTSLLKDRPLPRDGSGPWIQLLGQTGDSQQLQKLFEEVVLSGEQNGFSEAARKAATLALINAATLRNTRPAGNLDRITTSLSAKDESTRTSGIGLVGAWKLPSAVPQLSQIASDDNAIGGVRAGAVQALRQIATPEAVEALRKLIVGTSKTVVREAAAVALANLDFANSSKEIAQVVMETTAENESLALWRALLNVKNAGARLAKALPRIGLPSSVAKTGMRVAREGNRKEPELIAALERYSAADEPAGPSDAEIQQLAKEASGRGDPSRGEKVYRRMELACVSCHSIGGAGGKVGPDLTSIGASAPADYLIESIFYPNRKIKEGFHSLIVQTKDEQELSGLLVRETNEQLILRDASGKDISIPKNNIQKQQTGASLMPSGLVDALPAGDRLDLFRFLSELGKPGRFDASKGGVARVWWLRPGTHTVEQFGEEGYLNGPAKPGEWMNALSYVDGRLAQEQLKEAMSGDRYSGIVSLYALCVVEASRAGVARFVLETTSPAEIWIDGKRVQSMGAGQGGDGAVQAEVNFSANVEQGKHFVVVKVHPKNLPESLRLKSTDVTFIAE